MKELAVEKLSLLFRIPSGEADRKLVRAFEGYIRGNYSRFSPLPYRATCWAKQGGAVGQLWRDYKQAAGRGGCCLRPLVA